MKLKIKIDAIRNNSLLIKTQLLMIVAVGYIANLYYFGKLNWLTGKLFQLKDPPYLPWNSQWEVEPLWGVHYFGDLQHVIAFAVYGNPWDAPFAGTPLALNFTAILGIFGTKQSLFLYLALNAFTIMLLIRVWSKGQSLWSMTVIAVICFPLNISSIFAIDRGNLVLVTVCCVGIAIGRIHKYNKFDHWSALYLVAAVSLKTYVILIIILLAITFHSEWRFFRKIALWLLGLNSLLLITFPGSPIGNANKLLQNFASFTDPEYVVSILPTSGSLLYLLQWSQSQFLSINIVVGDLQFVVMFMWMLIVGVACALEAIPKWLKLFFVVSTFQMAIPGGAYVMTWNVVAILLLTSNWKEAQNQDYRLPIEKAIEILAWVTVLICSAPHDARFWLSPILVIFIIVTTLICYGPLRSRIELMKQLGE